MACSLASPRALFGNIDCRFRFHQKRIMRSCLDDNVLKPVRRKYRDNFQYQNRWSGERLTLLNQTSRTDFNPTVLGSPYFSSTFFFTSSVISGSKAILTWRSSSLTGTSFLRCDLPEILFLEETDYTSLFHILLLTFYKWKNRGKTS